MKILGLQGSPRGSKGNTALLLDAVLAGAEQAGAETELIALGELKLSYCKACHQCHRTGNCVVDDDIPEVQKKMVEADGIVLASPNYINSVTAQMKTLMDRCSYMIHCLLLDGKYGAAVATAGGSEEREVAEYQNRFLRNCGAWTVGHTAARAAGMKGLVDQEKAVAEATQLGGELVASIREQRRFLDQEASRQAFYNRMKDLILATKGIWTYEYDHWQMKGWLP